MNCFHQNSLIACTASGRVTGVKRDAREISWTSSRTFLYVSLALPGVYLLQPSTRLKLTNRSLTSTIPDSCSNHANTVHSKRRTVMQRFIGIRVCIEHRKKRRTTVKETARIIDERRAEGETETNTYILNRSLASFSEIICFVTTD